MEQPVTQNYPQNMEKVPFFYGKHVRVAMQIMAALFFGLTVSLVYFAGQWAAYADFFEEFLVIISAVTCGLITLGLAIPTCLVAGKESPTSAPKIYEFDRFWMDVMLLIAFLIFAFWTSWVNEIFYWDVMGHLAEFIATICRCFLSSAFVGGVILIAMRSVIRQVRAKRYRFATANIFKEYIQKGTQTVKDVFDEKRYQAYDFQKQVSSRQRVLLITVLVLTITSIFFYDIFFLFMLGIVGMVIWYIRKQDSMYQDLAKLMRQVDEITAGNLTFTSQISVTSPLYKVSTQLNEIQDGFQKSVDEQIKSEHMKIELITNVSHDLKTPLTSIISYVDLLSKEELSAEAKDYVTILAQKSERLKNIVADLFTLAKVTSGNEQIDMEYLDMSKLVVQTLSDMDDRISQSEMMLKTNIQDPPILIYADGRKLYRVLQNLIDNSLKYALAGTRIFIDLSADKQSTTLVIKNTAGYEMNFTAEEIQERFTRGDESRSTEGNGLGLSIAKGFTSACGGMMNVCVDGDQFKVVVTFPLAQEKVETEEVQEEQKTTEEPMPTASVPAPLQVAEQNPPAVRVDSVPVTPPNYPPNNIQPNGWNYLPPKNQ